MVKFKNGKFVKEQPCVPTDDDIEILVKKMLKHPEALASVKQNQQGVRITLPRGNYDWSMDVIRVINILCGKHGKFMIFPKFDRSGVSYYTWVTLVIGAESENSGVVYNDKGEITGCRASVRW